MKLQFLWEFIRDNGYILLLVWLSVFCGIKMAAVYYRDETPLTTKSKTYRYFLWFSLTAYLALLLYATMLGREPFAERRAELTLFWEYRLALTSNSYWFWQIFNNIILFIPMGVLYGELSKKSSWRKALLLGAGVSAAIEGIQFWFKVGLCETDDIFNNTVGMMIGFLFWAASEKVKNSRKKNQKIENQGRTSRNGGDGRDGGNKIL